MNKINELYNLWKKRATGDVDLVNELNSIENDENAKSEAFYKDLEFGTAGLRGIIGAGTNRLNIYTIGKASQGLASYVNSITDKGSIAIAYDSRIKSDVFAVRSAEVFAANGIKVYIYKELMPTPMLSYAVRTLKCDAGIVITASHNPAKYNGYKAYDNTGCQLCPEAAEYVLDIMQKVDAFDGVKSINFEDGLKSGIIEYISDEIYNSYIEKVYEQRITKDIDYSAVNIIYSPLNGTGNKPVRAILDKIGIKNLNVVKSQELPDGNFPTSPYPNPEIHEAFTESFKVAEKIDADLLIATDPDCDRVGIAVKTKGEFRLLSGNDVGVIMLNYILSRRKELGTLPEKPLAVKTIVTTELIKSICKKYNCELKEVLTGFKFIGEQITALAEKGEDNRYVLGFEESYGYLIGTHARDKDAVVASMMICEMTAYYKSKGKTLCDVLDDIYREFGYYYCIQKSFTFEGQSGMKKISSIMDELRENPPKTISEISIKTFKDFDKSVSLNLFDNSSETISLPRSNVLGFYLSDGSSVIIRPSGTEPKIKLYIGAVGETDASCREKLENLLKSGMELLGV